MYWFPSKVKGLNIKYHEWLSGNIFILRTSLLLYNKYRDSKISAWFRTGEFKYHIIHLWCAQRALILNEYKSKLALFIFRHIVGNKFNRGLFSEDINSVSWSRTTMQEKAIFINGTIRNNLLILLKIFPFRFRFYCYQEREALTKILSFMTISLLRWI